MRLNSEVVVSCILQKQTLSSTARMGRLVICTHYTDDNLTLEEADNRIICHIRHMIKVDLNLTSIKVRSADTDVIVILLAFMPQFKLPMERSY